MTDCIAVVMSLMSSSRNKHSEWDLGTEVEQLRPRINE